MIRRTFILLVLLAAGAGCDDPFIDPFANDGRYFTVWGWLDPDAPVQTVRVIPVSRWPQSVRQEGDRFSDIDARVFSTDLNSGVETEWIHQRQRLDDGTIAHIFRGAVDVRPAGRYRLEVRRSDGRVASAETRVPADWEFEGLETGEVFMDADGHLKQDVILRGVATPWDIVITYLAEGDELKRGAWIEYGRAGRRLESGDWAVTVDLTADQVDVHADIEAGRAVGEVPGPDEEGNLPDFTLSQMGVRFMALNAEWDLPDGPVNEEVFSRPGMLTNVTNGYGYWGSAVRHFRKWGVPTDLSIRLGWDY